jgi:hypothetical protein
MAWTARSGDPALDCRTPLPRLAVARRAARLSELRSHSRDIFVTVRVPSRIRYNPRSLSSRPIIVCPQCRSYRAGRVEPVSWPDRLRQWYRIQPRDRLAGWFTCGACGFAFEVRNSVEHCRTHPPDGLRRCRACDRTTLQLVARNHRYSEWQSPEEIADLYRCTNCGKDTIVIVQDDPLTLYD